MGKIIKKEKIKKVFLDDLPRKEGIGKNKNKKVIDWLLSIGYKVRFIYDNTEGWLDIVDYKDKHLYIKYLDNPIFIIFIGSFQNCQLGKLLNKITNEFRYNIGDCLKDEYRDIIITDRNMVIEEIIYDDKKRRCKRKIKLNKKYYKYKCNKCGFDCGEHYKKQEHKEEYWIKEESLNNKLKIPCCDNKIVIQGYNDIPTTAPWMVKYFQGGYDEAKKYTKSSSKSIYPICPDCGKVKNKLMNIDNIYTRHSIGCICSDGISYPNKFMFNLLEQLNLEFISEYSPDWIKPKKYDFYIPSMNLIIEMDGELGHGKKVYDKSKSTIEESKSNDDYKDIKAKENNNKIIRINCDKSELEFIKQNILNSELNELFDLSKMDWNKCEEFALSNRVKEACEYWNGGIKSTKEISEIMKINRGTVIIYLNKGTKIGLSIYNGREELIKSNIKNANLNSKQVEIFKDNKSFGIFSSGTELSKQSEELFGIHINSARISEVCNGKRVNFKGFIFKYI